MRPEITEGMTKIENAYRDLQLVATPPTDARDLRLALADFIETLNRAVMSAAEWSTDIRQAARGGGDELEEVLLGRPYKARQAVGAVDDGGI